MAQQKHQSPTLKFNVSFQLYNLTLSVTTPSYYPLGASITGVTSLPTKTNHIAASNKHNSC